MTVMAVFQDVDKCMRCNGCVIACKREWNMKNFTDIEDVKPQRSVVNPRQRMAIKSQKRVDMGPFIRFSCWHCPDPPCATRCPLDAITKTATGAVAVDNTKCDPTECVTAFGTYPCVSGCQRGGYPKVGEVYESGPFAGLDKMNKCTLCSGRAGSDAQVGADALPTRQFKDAQGRWPSPLELPSGGSLPDPFVPELAHEPACVASCPAKAMKWDSRANILAWLDDPANGFVFGAGSVAPGTKNWMGNGSMFWGSRNVLLTPAKADPYIEDHVTPMTSNLLSSKLVVPALVVGGLAAISARRVANESDSKTGSEV